MLRIRPSDEQAGRLRDTIPDGTGDRVAGATGGVFGPGLANSRRRGRISNGCSRHTPNWATFSISRRLPFCPVIASDLAFLQPTAKAGPLGRLAHYEILEVIGRGGCGIVLKATDEKSQRIVAIKAMAFPWTASSTARKRFLREARAAAAISDNNVVPIHAVEEEGSVPYLVMQYVAGESLEEKLRREGTIGLAEVLRIGVQVAEGLAAAHAQGIVHRDIKPANILLEGKSGRVKITDFGLAHAIDDSSAGGERIIAGTPDYMAPEQARGEAVNHQADLFSFGCVLYRILTGQVAFQRRSNGNGRTSRRCRSKPKPPRQLNPEVPAALSKLIMRLLALRRTIVRSPPHKLRMRCTHRWFAGFSANT